jgi:hypothetical protein
MQARLLLILCLHLPGETVLIFPNWLILLCFGVIFHCWFYFKITWFFLLWFFGMHIACVRFISFFVAEINGEKDVVPIMFIVNLRLLYRMREKIILIWLVFLLFNVDDDPWIRKHDFLLIKLCIFFFSGFIASGCAVNNVIKTIGMLLLKVFFLYFIILVVKR